MVLDILAAVSLAHSSHNHLPAQAHILVSPIYHLHLAATAADVADYFFSSKSCSFLFFPRHVMLMSSLMSGD